MRDELDILREMGSVAAAHGSIALSELIGKKIQLHLPNIRIINCKDIEGNLSLEGMLISLHSKIISGLPKSNVVFIIEEKNAYKFVDICYHEKIDKIQGSFFTEIGISLIKEIGNIIISSYVNSLGFYLKKLLIPSFPILINAPFSEILKVILSGLDKDYIIVIESIFEELNEKIKGNFWLVLNPAAAEDIRKSCLKILEGLKN